jgi:hypothetical protein
LSSSARPAPPADDVWRGGLRWTPFLPATLAAIASLAPRWSLAWAIVAASFLGASVVLMVLVVYGGRYESMKWRGAYVMLNFDLLAFFALVIVWRNLEAARWVDWLLGAAFAGTALAGHRFRRAIAQELLAPRTPLGLAFAALGSIGAGAAGILAYSTGRALPRAVLLGELYLGALVIVLVSHSFWTKAEDPSWQPRPSRRRKSSAR